MRKPDFTTSDRKRGVSPVIGVILMVAITVILAAVIASFVLGFGGSVNENAQAGVTIDDNSSGGKDVTVTSLGDNTDTVWCSDDSPTSENSTSTVGQTFQCATGANIVANTTSNSSTVVRTDI